MWRINSYVLIGTVLTASALKCTVVNAVVLVGTCLIGTVLKVIVLIGKVLMRKF